MNKCPKCGKTGDINTIYLSKGELIFERCGHSYNLEYVGYYDEHDSFHDVAEEGDEV